MGVALRKIIVLRDREKKQQQKNNKKLSRLQNITSRGVLVLFEVMTSK